MIHCEDASRSTSSSETLALKRLLVGEDALVDFSRITPGAGSPPLVRLGLIDILLAGSLVLADKVRGRVAAKPRRELGQLLAEAVDRLLVHVGLRNELGHSDWNRQRNVNTEMPSKPTEKTGEVLSAIGRGCARDLSLSGCRPLLVELVVLLAFEAARRSSEHDQDMQGRVVVPVQQDATQALVKVLEQAGDCLLQNLERRGALHVLGALVREVVVEDLGDGLLVGEGHKLLVLGDVLPVVDQEGLEMVGDRNLDRRATVEGVLLENIVSILVAMKKGDRVKVFRAAQDGPRPTRNRDVRAVDV